MHPPAGPSEEILRAFSLTDEPVLLKGGQGITWKSGETVLKPITSSVETSWCAELIESLPQDTFRTAKHKKAYTNSWVYNGWEALEFIEGAHLNGHWKEKIAVCKGFNDLLRAVPKPDFIEKRTDPWAIAGQMTWEELPLHFDERLSSYINKIKKHLHPIVCESQIVHGDITGNMLFAPYLPPGVIDFTPTFRPKEYALGILIVDALTWEGADESIFMLLRQEKNMFQYLLRAAFFRTLVTSEFYLQKKIDRFSELPRHENVLQVILENHMNLS